MLSLRSAHGRRIQYLGVTGLGDVGAAKTGRLSANCPRLAGKVRRPRLASKVRSGAATAMGTCGNNIAHCGPEQLLASKARREGDLRRVVLRRPTSSARNRLGLVHRCPLGHFVPGALTSSRLSPLASRSALQRRRPLPRRVGSARSLGGYDTNERRRYDESPDILYFCEGEYHPSVLSAILRAHWCDGCVSRSLRGPLRGRMRVFVLNDADHWIWARQLTRGLSVVRRRGP